MHARKSVHRPDLSIPSGSPASGPLGKQFPVADDSVLTELRWGGWLAKREPEVPPGVGRVDGIGDPYRAGLRGFDCQGRGLLVAAGRRSAS